MAQADHFAAVFCASRLALIVSSLNLADPRASTDFLAGIIVLNFWFSQLFVAVVTNVFGDIRSETKKSAFSAAL